MSQLNALLKNEAMMKRQRVALTRSQKKEIRLLLSQKPPLTQTAVARSYGIKQNTVSNIWNKREKCWPLMMMNKEKENVDHNTLTLKRH